MFVGHKKNRYPASIFWIPLFQFGVTLLLSLAVLLLGVQSAVSVLCGGLIAVAGSTLYTWRFYRRGNSLSAKDMLKDAYQGAFSKLLLTALLFGLVLGTFKELEVLLLFVGFVAAQIVSWIAPLLLKRQVINKT